MRNGLVVTLVGLVVLVAARNGTGIGAARSGRVLRGVGLVAALSGGLLIGYGAYVAAGPDDPTAERLLPGVDYERFVHRSAVAHLVTIDLTHRCVEPAASVVAEDGTAAALKTVNWADRQAMAVAINGSFFYPYDQSRFWDVKPAEGEEVTILGPTVFSKPGAAEVGSAVSETEWAGHTLSISAAGAASIGETVAGDAAVAITGRDRLIENGRIVAPPTEPYPRTVVGVDGAGTTMWWLVVDGKQPGYSDGLSLREAAGILAKRGATDAVELDGGGSSILVARTDSSDGAVERLSRPMQIRIPGRSRAVGNHLGLRLPTDPTC